MKAFIFAAGLGTRLRPLTDSTPKALVEAGRGQSRHPLLWWTVQRLKAAGADDIVINVHHFADKVEAYVRSVDAFGVNVSFSDERDCLMDTGGGLLKAEKLLLGSGPFIVHNVDILSNLDLKEFTSKPLGASVARLAVSDRPSDRRLLFDAAMHLVGWKNAVTGQLRGPAAGDYSLVAYEKSFSGIHYISENIFNLMALHPEFSGIFPIIDFYLEICSEIPVEGYWQPGFDFLDAGTPETLAMADKYCVEL